MGKEFDKSGDSDIDKNLIKSGYIYIYIYIYTHTQHTHISVHLKKKNIVSQWYFNTIFKNK